MPYNRKIHGVFACLVKEGLDLREFSHRFMTGRVAKDYEIMRLLRSRNLQEAFSALASFRDNYEKMLKEYDPTVEELHRKKWIFKNQVNKARKIMKLYRSEGGGLEL